MNFIPNTVNNLDTKTSMDLWAKVYSYECGYWSSWVTECRENRAFYYGYQSTEAEREEIAEKGQYEIVINKIRKAIRGIVGMIAANIPQYKLLPLSNNDYHTASIGERVIKWVWANSSGKSIMRLFVKNSAVDNVCYLCVYQDEKNNTRVRTASFNEVLPDPSSTDPMYRDAEMIILRRDVSTEYVKLYYGITDELITKIQFEYSAPGIERDTTSGTTISFSSFLEKVYSADRLYVRIYEMYKKVPERMQDGTVRVRIHKNTLIGFNHIYHEVLPEKITEYPIIPGYVDKAENPYPRGEVHFVKDLQRFVNKSYGVTLLNAQLLSNPKVFMKETDIPNNDVESFQETFNVPGSINVVTANSEPPFVLQGQPLNQAFFTLYADAKQEVSWNLIPQEMIGMMNSDTNRFSASATLEMKQTVLDSFRDFLDVIEMACAQLGKVVLQFARAYLEPNKVIRIIGEEDLFLNKKQELNLEDEQSVQRWISYQQKRGVPEDEIASTLSAMKIDDEKKKSIEYFVNATDFDDYDVTVVPGSYTQTFEVALMRLMFELAQVGAVDPSAILKYLPVDNREELQERFDAIRTLSARVEDLQKEVDDYKGIVSKQEQAIVSERLKSATIKGTAKIDKDVAQQRIKSYLARKEHSLGSREAMNKLYLEIEKILNDVELEAEKQKFLAKQDMREPLNEATILDMIGE